MKGDDTAIGTGFRVRLTGEDCQVCGAPMKEEFRTHQSCVVFVWFECSRTGCSGTFLRKGETD